MGVRLRGGAFFTYVGCSPSSEKDVRDLLMFELEKATERAPAAEEIRSAKAYTQGSHAIGLQGNRAMAYAYLHQHLAGRGLTAVTDYDRRIEAVTPDQVRAAAADVFDLDNCAFGIVRGKPA
jgi:zinc protease